MSDRKNISISVIIPVFNGERYLAEAIESVLAQTFPVMEIIVVDDGSTDRTAEIAKQFEGKIAFQTRPHLGIAPTRNHGVRNATGNWLAFLDADDLWHPQKIEWQLAVLKKEPYAEIIFGGIEQFFSSDLSDLERSKLDMKLTKSHAPHCGTMLVCHDFFRRVGFFHEQTSIIEFIEWFNRAQEAHAKFLIVPEILMRRRWHSANSSRQKMAYEQLPQMLKTILDRRKKKSLHLP